MSPHELLIAPFADFGFMRRALVAGLALMALVVFILAWLHGVLSGTDSDTLRFMYIGAGLAVLGAGVYRYWASRQRKPTFTTSRPEVAVE